MPIQRLNGSQGSWPIRSKVWLSKYIPFLGFSASSAEVAFPQSIIGDDDRVIEIDTLGIPQRLIVSLTIFSESGARFFGSGCLVSSNLVLTCGHCVFDQQLGGFASRIEIVPGLSRAQQPFGKLESTSFDAHPQWKSSADRAFDMGCIYLAQGIGSKLGHFAIGKWPASASDNGQKIRCAGYPYFDGGHSLQLSSEGVAKKIIGTNLYHDIDTDNGTSGGPIWLADDSGSPPTVVAIHSFEKQAIPGQPGELANSATLINDATFDILLSWANSIE
jgi:V8-like Glu-specific endopeptidase